MTTVCIPTRGRAYDQRTLGYLRGTKWENRTYLVVPQEEVHLHSYDRIMAHDAEGISATRQWIVDSTTDDVIMLDDDLMFAVRRKDDPSKFNKATQDDVVNILDTLEAMLDLVPVCGLSARQGGNNLADAPPVLLNTRINAVHAISCQWMHDNNVRYRKTFMEDFDMVLQVLSLGVPTASLTTHAWDNYKTNAPGGCSIYRTLEGQAAASYDLEATWPDFVTSVEKTQKGGGEGWAKRIDVRVQWQKAARAGVLNRDMLGLEPWPELDWSRIFPAWGLL